MVRKMGRWMQQLDERILEYLSHEGWATADTLTREFGPEVSKRRIRERFRVLSHAGLVSPYLDSSEADTFEITGWGELYLKGEVNAELIRPIPRPRPPDKVRPGEWAGFV